MMATACQHCSADVSGVAQIVCEAYDHVEIPEIKPDITRVTLSGGTCPCCAKRFKAPPPQGLEPGSPFGPNLRAFVVYLRFTQGISFERLAKLCRIFSGSTSAKARWSTCWRQPDPFATQTSLIRAQLLSGTALDRMRPACGSATQLVAMGVSSQGQRCLRRRCLARRSVVSAFLGDFRPDLGLRPLRRPVRLGGKGNQVCLAHFIRDVQYAIDAGDSIFAPELRHLLGRACRIGRRRTSRRRHLKVYAARLEARLDRLMARTPTHAAGVKLQRIVKKIRRHLFVFVTNRDIPATNNGSGALRPCAVPENY
jgi:transposase